MEGYQPGRKEKKNKEAEEARQISRLREEQEIAIQQTKERIDILETFKQDYIALKDRLVTLPDKISHDVMVPFGKLAFMPGKLVHTNEILVLLGDDWFAEMSAKHASHTVDRRISVLDDQVKELQKQAGLLEPRLEFTSELQDIAQAKGDLVEIKEEYDEDKEKVWREEHRRKVRAYNTGQRKEEERLAREAFDERKKQEALTDSALWDRLDELEKLEDQAGEMNITSSGSGSEGSSEEDCSGSTSTRKIRWQDEGPKPRDRNKTIYFSHTETDPTTTTPADQTSPRGQGQLDSVSSPADIYAQHMGQQRLKSILKPSTSGSQSSTQTRTQTRELEGVRTDTVGSQSDRQVVTGGVEAFKGSVVEKAVTPDSSAPEPVVVESQITETTQTDRPVSRFKAQRMARK